jgi:hypothetical protein
MGQNSDVEHNHTVVNTKFIARIVDVKVFKENLDFFGESKILESFFLETDIVISGSNHACSMDGSL